MYTCMSQATADEIEDSSAEPLLRKVGGERKREREGGGRFKIQVVIRLVEYCGPTGGQRGGKVVEDPARSLDGPRVNPDKLERQ